jgi:hypothetical protein
MSHIQAVIEAHRERFLAEFCEFLSFPSESSNAEGLAHNFGRAGAGSAHRR